MGLNRDGCTWYDYCELAGVPPEPQDVWKVFKCLTSRDWYIGLAVLEEARAHYSDLPWVGPAPQKMGAIHHRPMP